MSKQNYEIGTKLYVRVLQGNLRSEIAERGLKEKLYIDLEYNKEERDYDMLLRYVENDKVITKVNDMIEFRTTTKDWETEYESVYWTEMNRLTELMEEA